MEYRNEYEELTKEGINVIAKNYCDPGCVVITPFDMVVDQVTKIWSENILNEHHYDTCGYGTWCAIEGRVKNDRAAYTIKDFSNKAKIPELMEDIWNECFNILEQRGVEKEKLPGYEEVFSKQVKNNVISRFTQDLEFFFKKNEIRTYRYIWNHYNYHIFEGSQGLGLDVDTKHIWHTTSKTGLANPYNMLKNKRGFNAEVCYVSRTYLTRHGDGPLENEVQSEELNNNIIDTTNVFNNLQGELRYGLIDKEKQEQRINDDYKIAEKDEKFIKTIAFTHCNEYSYDIQNSNYISDHKCRVKKINP